MREYNTTTPSRFFLLHVGPETAGTGNFGRMLVEADSTANAVIERYINTVADLGRFWVTGYWNLRPNATGITNTTEGGLTDGGRPGQTITISGSFMGGTGAAGCPAADFYIKIGAYTVPCGSITSWAMASIQFTIPTDITDYGGAGALVVRSWGRDDLTPVDFYVYPKIDSLTTPSVADAAREYDAGDTDGVITINGKRFGTAAPTVTILGQAATVNSWSDTAIEVQVPASIADDVYTGDIVVTQSAPNSKTVAFAGFRILPRITGINPTVGKIGTPLRLPGIISANRARVRERATGRTRRTM